MSSEVQEQSADYNPADLKPVLEKVSGNNTLLDSLPIWLSAQTTKSAGRGRSAGNTHQYGVQKLRELILELAVRGKLVEQDPDDEPASILLEKVAEEKTRLIKAGEIKKPRKLPTRSENDMPYSLPNGWEWTQIENIGHDWGQETPSEDFTYIDVASIDNARGVISNPSVLSSSGAPSRARKIVKTNTVIYSTIRPYLQNIAVILEDIEPKPIASTAFAVIHPLLGMSASYFLHYFRSPTFVKYVESVQTGIAYPAINDKQFFTGLVPVPPLNEQHRIVKKVDELMALCDKLEQQQTDAFQAHDTLVKVLLDTLTQSDNADDFQQNWRRITEHFDTLFTTDSSIDQLKQTLLQLAVMGKLVPQDPNDEPASVLLEKIAEEKAQLVKKGILKKQKTIPKIGTEEQPYELQNGWCWTRLGTIAFKLTDGSHNPPRNAGSGFPMLSSQNVNFGQVDFSNPSRFVTEDDFKKEDLRTQIKPGDVLLTIVASLGRAAVVPEDAPQFTLQRSVAVINSRVVPTFLARQLISPACLNYYDEHGKGTAQKGIYLGKLSLMPLALPPLAEQQRIAKKVDELMALCDQLKDRLHQTQTLQQQLADAVVDSTIKP